MPRLCPQCHQDSPAELQFCPHDGTPLIPDPVVGQVLGDRYRVVRPIGEGAMGAVYEAVDERQGTRVAVKRLHPGMRNVREVVRRFEREWRATADLEHPNIVQTLDFGESPDGAMFLAMELVDGVPLDEVRDAGPQPAQRVIAIGRQLLAGLAAAHARGIVHRDLKPANVMVCADRASPGREIVKILDFGIARMLNAEDGEQLTRTGMVFGTPEYMAPEQALGQRVDHRADLYAVAVILYELACGKRPFESEDKIQLLAMHVMEKPAPPSQKADGLRIPSTLEGAILMGLEKQAEQRFHTADDFLRALELAERAVGQLETARTIPPSAAVAPTIPPGGSAGITTLRVRDRMTPLSWATEHILTWRPGLARARDWMLETGATARQLGRRRRWRTAGIALGAAVAVGLGIAFLWPDSPPAAEGGRGMTTDGAGAVLPSLFGTDPIRVPDETTDPPDLFDTLPVASAAERMAADAMRRGDATGVLRTLASAPPSAAASFLRGRALAMVGRWKEASPELLAAFATLSALRTDRELLQMAITAAGGTGKEAKGAGKVLEAVGVLGAAVMAERMFAAHETATELAARIAEAKGSGATVSAEDRRALKAARRLRKVLRRTLEKTAPEAADLSEVWVAELQETGDCAARAALIRRIRKRRVESALPALRRIRREGTGLLSGNHCLRKLLPATIAELETG